MTSSPHNVWGGTASWGWSNAPGNEVSEDSHVSIRKERKTLQQAFVSKQFGFE